MGAGRVVDLVHLKASKLVSEAVKACGDRHLYLYFQALRDCQQFAFLLSFYMHEDRLRLAALEHSTKNS